MSMKGRDKEEEPKMKRMKLSEREGEEDRLSNLPDCILLHIMKFMKTKEAVQTCILSKRWKNLWKFLPSLKLHSSDLRKLSSFKKYVSKVLSGCNGSLTLERLYFKRYGFIEPQLLNKVAKYATSHGVQELSINVGLGSYLEIPPCIFSCKSITYLKISLRTKLGWSSPLPKSIALPALETLHLVNVIFIASNQAYAEPFLNCEKLNTLIIDSCLCQAKALIISSDKLVNLSIRGKYRRKIPYKIELSTPNLGSLKFSGRSTHKLSGCNLPLLKEAEIALDNFSDKDYPEKASMVMSFLRLFANVKLLSLSWPTLVVLSYICVAMDTQPPCFTNLKSLMVRAPFSSPESNEKLIKILEYLLQKSPSDQIDIIYHF